MNKKRRTDYLDYTQTPRIPKAVNVTAVSSPSDTYKAEISTLDSPISCVDPPEVTNWNNFLIEKVVNLFRIKFTIVSTDCIIFVYNFWN